MKKIKIVFILFCAFTVTLVAQNNPYGLTIINSIEKYNEHISKDSSNVLIDLTKYIPDMVVDVKYASTDNFMKTKLYDTAAVFLRLPAAKALALIQKELKEKNLGIKVLDAYRPYSVTLKIWEAVKDDRYAAPPNKGSRHNRGCAVDLTLVDLITKEELLMPTGFDDFSNRAHHNYMALPKKAIENREILKNVMIKYGFETITSEWWHYDFKGWSKFPLMDIKFEDLSD